MIQVNDLTFKHIRYPSFTLKKGYVTFLVGPSGVGKSTLFQLINQSKSPTQGSIQYTEFKDIHNPIAIRQQALLVSQDVFLYDDTIENNFIRFYTLRNLTPPTTNMIQEFLKICCIDVDVHKQTRVLSGGERQRVYLAIFLSFTPPLLLLDEPTSALDKAIAKQVFTSIIRYAKQHDMTLFIISHDTSITDMFQEATITLGGLYA